MRDVVAQWLRTDRRTPFNGIDDEFFDRLNVALANVHERGPIVPRVPNLCVYQHPQVVVALANLANFFAGLSDDYEIRDEFMALAKGYVEPPMPVTFSTSKLKRSVLIRKYQSTWTTIDQDLRDGHRNGLSAAAKVGAGGLWLELKALVWASERGKLRELPVMFNESLASAFHHLRGQKRT
ncbi:MAG: hypothetical protein Q8R49_08985 [Rhodoferax sp.]|nr:hypothetical protein [Rhodoferax sp.]